MTVIAYLATPIDAHHLRTLLIGLDAVVSVNDIGFLVIETPDVSMIDPRVPIHCESCSSTISTHPSTKMQSDNNS